jgi:hypothetical protein
VTGGGIVSLTVMAGAVIVAYLVYVNREKLKTAFNPLSTKNLAYQGASKVVQAVTGDPTATVGTKIADWFKTPAEKAVDEMLKPVAKTPTSGYELSPASFGTSTKSTGSPKAMAWEDFFGT